MYALEISSNDWLVHYRTSQSNSFMFVLMADARLSDRNKQFMVIRSVRFHRILGEFDGILASRIFRMKSKLILLRYSATFYWIFYGNRFFLLFLLQYYIKYQIFPHLNSYECTIWKWNLKLKWKFIFNDFDLGSFLFRAKNTEYFAFS